MTGTKESGDAWVAVRELARPTFTERHVSARASSAASLYAAVAPSLEGALVVQEKVYGPPGGRADTVAARAAAGLDAEAPLTYLRDKTGGGAASVQLWSVVPHDGAMTVTTVQTSACRGRLLEAPDLRMLWLAEIAGTLPDGALADGVARQAETMFSNAAAALSELGFSYTHVIRTWLYARRLLDWYGELNRVRTSAYRNFGIEGGPGGHAFPASTGVQGARDDNEECVMDLLALASPHGRAVATPVMSSSRQGSPWSYGSAFTRAMLVAIDGVSTVLLSGTSSIAPGGETLHPLEPEAQVLETLLSIGALLEPAAGLPDLASGTLFYRHIEALAAYERTARLLSLPTLPLVPVHADVCRGELTVEIDGIILPGSAPKGPTGM